MTEESDYTSYEVHYKTKNGKLMNRAYAGDSKEVYEQVIRELQARDDIRYLAATESQIHVILFD